MNYYLYIFAFLLAGSLFSACSAGPGKDSASTGEEPATTVSEGAPPLELTDEQMKSVGITVGPLSLKNLDAVVRASGQLAVPPQNKADVSVLSGGLIRKINVLEGQQVRKGQVLATIESQELIRLQQDYLTAKSNFTYAGAEYDRQTQLRDAGAGTGKSYQSAQSTYLAEQARVSGLESQLRQLGLAPGRISSGNIVSSFPLVSPISGTVGQITANTGAFVPPGTAIMEVVDNAKIHCDLVVFEKDLMKVKIGQKVDFQLTNQEEQGITGTINGINKSFENESKGVIVHAIINNAGRKNLIPGMYVTALISVGTRLDLAVPAEALVRAEGKQYIFVVDETAHPAEGRLHFVRAAVATGVSELGYTQIIPLNKLPEGARIVTKGAFYLQSKAAGNAGDE